MSRRFWLAFVVFVVLSTVAGLILPTWGGPSAKLTQRQVEK